MTDRLDVSVAGRGFCTGKMWESLTCPLRRGTRRCVGVRVQHGAWHSGERVYAQGGPESVSREGHATG